MAGSEPELRACCFIKPRIQRLSPWGVTDCEKTRLLTVCNEGTTLVVPIKHPKWVRALAPAEVYRLLKLAKTLLSQPFPTIRACPPIQEPIIPFQKWDNPKKFSFTFASNYSHLCQSVLKAKNRKHGGPPRTAGARVNAIALRSRPFVFCVCALRHFSSSF